MAAEGKQFAVQTRMIEQLQYEIKMIRRETGQLDEVRRGIGRLDGLLEQVAGVAERVDRMERRLTKIYDQLVLGENLAQARHEQQRLERRLREDFTGRNQIRALAVSMVSAAGAAMIRDGVVEQQTVIDEAGRNMLKDADFWLAAALLAIANEQYGREWISPKAWGFVAASDQASGQAKSDLFLSLFCSLQGRHDAASSSMSRYLEELDPQALGREFSQVINALAEGELGEQARSYAHEALNRWGRTLRASNAKQFEICRGHLMLYRQQFPAAFPTLREYAVPDRWQEVEKGWAEVTACGLAAREFRERLAEGAASDRRLGRKTYSQRALRALIQQLEPDEMELKRSIHTQELIMQCGGDKERAAALAEKLGDPFTATSDLATFLTQAAFTPDAYGLVPQARRFAMACAANWIMDAARSVVADAARQRPRTLPIRWRGWNDEIDAEAPRDAEVARLTGEVGAYIAATRRAWWPSGTAAGAAVAAVAVCAYLLTRTEGRLEWAVGLAAVAVIVYHLTVLVSYPVRKRRARRMAVLEQERAGRTIPPLVDEARALLGLWDEHARGGIAELGDVLGAPPIETRG